MELTKVYSLAKRIELEKILLNPRARHNQRLYFVGFLKSVGYFESEICDIIRNGNRWDDYIDEYTSYQVRHVFMAKSTQQKSKSSPHAKHAPTLNDIIITFLRDMKQVSLNVPKNLYDAVAYYSYMGFTVLPKQKGEKRPIVSWKEYITKKPGADELINWDFSNGLCLLANDEYSFLDIDKPGYEFLLDRWHKERTPGGGIHVFGKGKIESINVEGGEIKGKGTLIIAAPTPGYQTV